jgi:predicted transcriptional regulator
MYIAIMKRGENMKKTFTCYLPEELKEQMKSVAKKLHLNQTAIVIIALNQFMKENN